MLLALIICQLLVLVTPNPFHKYPFVFLLDVGNEELEKANSEQIRLSVPGGSVALRYPAIGDGNPIVHIRVSGIDFGTDLKANIVDGGPGYKYVVLVFMGNPGIAYDAVVTVQTVNDQTFNIQNIGSIVNSETPSQVEDDVNNSAEDLSDDSQNQNYVQSSNAELMQSSSNVYNYAESEVIEQRSDANEDNDDDDDNGGEESGVDEHDNEKYSANESPDLDSQEDIHQQYDEVDQADDSDIQVKSIDTIDEDDDDDDDGIGPKAEQYSNNDYAEENEPISIVDTQINSKYDGLKPHLIGGEVYYQYDEQKNIRPDYQQEPLDYEDPDAEQPVFNDGENHDDVDKYRDTNNNNYIDTDDNFAVAY